MAETVGSQEIDEGFTHAKDVLADGDLVVPEPESIDPVPVTSKELKEEAEEERRDSGRDLRNLKSTILITGAAVAVIGAIFAIAKKIKEA